MVDPKSLREAIKENTVFVSVQMVNSEIGTIQNIREIAKEVRHVRKEKLQKFASNGAGGKFLNSSLLLHTDASQAPLWLPLNVEKLGVDLLTIDAQKMLGPKGVGALFVRRLAAGSQAALTLAPLIYGGGQERGRRSGTENVAHAAALAVALREAQLDVEARAATFTDIRDFLISEIQKIIPRAQLNGAEGAARVANNINISIKGLNGDLAVVALDARGIAASTRSACDTDDESPSHVLKAIGKTPEEAKNSLRITLLPDATIGQATRILEALKAVTSRYRQQL
jgi:cysteine desulfurase